MHPWRGKGLRAAWFGLLVGLCLACLGASTALADGPVGSDPASNFAVGQLPLACGSSPNSTTCINGAVYWLDRARAQLNPAQGPYKLPADFASLSPDKQAFILTNLDRLQYGLTPITGLTTELDGFALTGVQQDADPISTDPNFAFTTSNWAGDFINMAVAYEAWMYDDGLNSGNIECTPGNMSGCWGHRHDVLWKFTYNTGAYAMGATTGHDTHGQLGYTMILGRGDSSYSPTYYYTWAQAVTSGAGSNNYVVKAPPVLAISVKPANGKIRIYISAPAHAAVQCQLSQWYQRAWRAYGFRGCSGPVTTYTGVSPGRYRVQVKAAGKTVTKYATVP